MSEQATTPTPTPPLSHIPQRVLLDAEDNVRWLRRQAGAFKAYKAWHGSPEAALLHMDESICVARIYCERGKLNEFRDLCGKHGFPVPTGLDVKMDDIKGMPDLLKALRAAGRVEWEDVDPE